MEMTLPSLSKILKMCEDTWEEFPNDPETCPHDNVHQKMYSTVCDDCGIVVSYRERNIFYANKNPDGTLDITGPA